MNRVLGKLFFCVVIFFGTILFVKLETGILKEVYCNFCDTSDILGDKD